MDSSPAIHIEGISKSYGHIHALSDLYLMVTPGEIFGFLGPNGAGKTTTIRIITGFVKPTRGEVRVFGLHSWRDSVRIKATMGFLPDSHALYGGMTGEQFLSYLGELHGNHGSSMRRELCQRLELSQSALKRRIKDYSRGMRQKLLLIQAMQHNPSLLVLDEPSEGLDPLMQQALFSILREFRDGGGTVFMSSHILSEVEQLCQRVGIIRDGQLVSVAKVQELQRGKVRYMEVEFREAPPRSLELPGVEVVSRDGGRWRLAIQGDVNPIVRKLAQYDLGDLVFEQARLEDIFLGYYAQEQTGASLD